MARRSHQGLLRDEHRGFTVFEVAVLLAVLSVLGAIVAAAASDVLERSRQVRAREDVEQVGSAITDFYTDLGRFPRIAAGEELGVLASDAALPEATAAAVEWTSSRTDSMLAHLLTNERGYTPLQVGGSRGWQGPYLSHPLGADPWGNAYLVNVFHLDPHAAVLDADGNALGAVFVLSAGPNGLLETPFFQPREVARTFGDDVAARLQ